MPRKKGLWLLGEGRVQPGGRDVTGVEKKHMLVVTLLGLELQPGVPVAHLL